MIRHDNICPFSSLLWRRWCSPFPSPCTIVSWGQGIHWDSTYSITLFRQGNSS
ncbi:hypothetical protein EV702DRAFT_1267930 [Suillus placidus]|uniref:Uncharacterized protein n=1 Tax=Suillus placidus TaxID=48579 RepID=A0A9P7D3R8_9AGAM|nr:hypothetical protein EV702DRAFT_1267930 [Suillus placidus]